MGYFTDRLEFMQVLQRESKLDVETVGRITRGILRHAATIQRLAVVACNRNLTPDEEKRDARAEQYIEELVASLGPGFKAKFSGDPRGCCVKIMLPSGAYNTWGGAEEGWGVPTERC